MGNKLSGVGRALYDPKRREFLGRDGGRWAKLGTFYFFFYLGLAGFFCAMLAVFMALTPRDHPYYYSHDSRMETRSNTLSPGLGFRPQPIPDKNLIVVSKGAGNKDSSDYATSLDQYLRVYYPQGQSGRGNSDNTGFRLPNAQACSNSTRFGFTTGQPCVLVKLNKIVGFEPTPFGDRNDPDTKEIPSGCPLRRDAVPIVCSGEFPADADNIGSISYISENGFSPDCGSLRTSHFPYRGKVNRQDVYQAPYIWAQFLKPKPNVLINVICRAFASNIDIDKKTGRGVTRFQIFVDQPADRRSQEL